MGRAWRATVLAMVAACGAREAAPATPTVPSLATALEHDQLVQPSPPVDLAPWRIEWR